MGPRAKDGYIAIAAGNNNLWVKVAEVVAMPELAGDPRFATTRDRAANQVVLLEARFTRETAAHTG